MHSLFSVLSVKYKLLCFGIVLVCMTAFVACLLPYLFERQALERKLVEEQLRLVRMAALAIDMPQYFHSDEGGAEDTKSYVEHERIRAILVGIHYINARHEKFGFTPLFIARLNTHHPTQLERILIGDVRNGIDRSETQVIERQPFHEKALAGIPASANIVKVAGNSIISAAAPILAFDGRVLAIVQADRIVDEDLKELKALKNRYLLGASIALLLGILLSFRLAQLFIGPIRTLLKVTQGYTKEGEKGLRHIDEHRSDEYGELFDAYNTMQDSLSEALGNLKTKNHELEHQTFELQSLALFSKLNPGPVLRINLEGKIVKANPPAISVFELTQAGARAKQFTKIFNELSRGELESLICDDETLTVYKCINQNWFQFVFRGVAEMEFINIYGSDINARMNAEALAKQAQAKAESANYAKTRFLATMSHELRTPLNAIVGYAGIMRRRNANSSIASQIQAIEAASEDLLVTINSILEYSQIEDDDVDIDEMDFPLDELSEGLYARYRGECILKKLDLFIYIDESLPYSLRGDEKQINHVLDNLVANAIKFTQKGTIIIKVQRVEDKNAHGLVMFSVKDTGIGIAKTDLESLFESFKQVDSSSTRRYGGTGLGLSIAQRTVLLMGGRLEVSSTLALGSEFYFSLPLIPERDRFISEKGRDERLELITLVVIDNRIDAQPYFNALFSGTQFDLHYSSANKLSSLNLTEPERAIVILNSQANDNVMDMAQALEKVSLGQRAKRIYLHQNNEGYSNWDDEMDSTFGRCLEKPFPARALIDVIKSIVGPIQGTVTDYAPSSNQNIVNMPNNVSASPSYIHKGFSLADQDEGLALVLPIVRKAHVLIVEDDPVNQALDCDLMQYAGASYEIASNGQEALNILENTQFDIVLMDVQMPIMDGCTATKHIRENAKFDTLPIVAVTANALVGDIDMCLNAGMTAYVSKPIDDKVLYSTMAECLLASNVEKFTVAKDVEYFDEEWVESGDMLDESLSEGELIEKNKIKGQVRIREKSSNYIIDLSAVRASFTSDDNFYKALEDFVNRYSALSEKENPVNATDIVGCLASLYQSDICLALPAIIQGLHKLDFNLEIKSERVLNDYWQSDLPNMLKALIEKIISMRESVQPNIYEELDEVSMIPGFECELALSRLGGKLKHYEKVLRNFYLNSNDKVTECRILYQQGNKEDSKRIAHTVKSLAATIGAEELKEKSKALEVLIQQDAPINEHVFSEYESSFNETLNKVLAYLDARA